jgi:hypothetical protein
MRRAFLDRYETDQQYLALADNEDEFRPYFSYDLGFGMIDPCYLVNLPALLPAYRKLLQSRNQLLEEKFDWQRLQLINDGV